MRAKQSSTASGKYSDFGTLTTPTPIRASAALLPFSSDRFNETWHEHNKTLSRQIKVLKKEEINNHSRDDPHPDSSQTDLPAPVFGVAYKEGLLHDARNLICALELYCDLFSRPGVLKPEHLHYANELRVLSNTYEALIERAMAPDIAVQEIHPQPHEIKEPQRSCLSVGESATRRRFVSLREVIERCSGLLSSVAGGRKIDLKYGPAASIPVSVDVEGVERILLNLVCNSAAALNACGSSPSYFVEGIETAGSTLYSDAQSSTMRICVGYLPNWLDDPKPWPFQRVWLTVEDSGCGMVPEQLDLLIGGKQGLAGDGHGIGFRVVRELVAADGGEILVQSAPGAGTRVQINWPAAMPAGDSAACEPLEESLGTTPVATRSAYRGRRARQGGIAKVNSIDRNRGLWSGRVGADLEIAQHANTALGQSVAGD